jgi:hypothetical protein
MLPVFWQLFTQSVQAHQQGLVRGEAEEVWGEGVGRGIEASEGVLRRTGCAFRRVTGFLSLITSSPHH